MSLGEALQEFGFTGKYSCIVCGEPARYGLIERIHCAKHAESTDKLLSNRIRCYKCDTVASFGLRTGKPEYCAKHAPNNYWNVYANLCGCGRVPHYGITKRITCSKCKLPEHKYLGTLCGCGKQPSYGPKGGSKVRCKDCKKKGDILLSIRKCVECKKRNANYGLSGGPKLTCSDCREDNHIALYSAPKCEICGMRANFRLPGKRANRCGKCRTPDHKR